MAVGLLFSPAASCGENGPSVEIRPGGVLGPQRGVVAMAGSKEGQRETTVNLGGEVRRSRMWALEPRPWGLDPHSAALNCSLQEAAFTFLCHGFLICKMEGSPHGVLVRTEGFIHAKC